MTKEIDDILDDRMTSGSGDYPPWMNETGDDDLPEGPVREEGDELQGYVVGRRDDPWHEGPDDPDPILHVEDDNGDVWSTRTHSILVNLINEQNVEVGDYIRIRHAGSFKTDTGQVANDYEIGVVKASELEEDEEPEATPDGGMTAEGVPNDALEFAESLLTFHGELSYDELDEYLNETRDLGVDVKSVVAELDGVSVNGNTVTKN